MKKFRIILMAYLALSLCTAAVLSILKLGPFAIMAGLLPYSLAPIIMLTLSFVLCLVIGALFLAGHSRTQAYARLSPEPSDTEATPTLPLPTIAAARPQVEAKSAESQVSEEKLARLMDAITTDNIMGARALLRENRDLLLPAFKQACLSKGSSFKLIIDLMLCFAHPSNLPLISPEERKGIESLLELMDDRTHAKAIDFTVRKYYSSADLVPRPSPDPVISEIVALGLRGCG